MIEDSNRLLQINTELFRKHFDRLAIVYHEAYAGFPWFEGDTVTVEVARERLKVIENLSGFGAFIFENLDGEAVGAELFDKPSIENLEKRKGVELRIAVTEICKETGIKNLVWENELFVKPTYQGLGVATALRFSLINHLESHDKEALVITRMRDDNIGTIVPAEKVGFQRTGVRKLASQQPDGYDGQLYHEFWYRIINQK